MVLSQVTILGPGHMDIDFNVNAGGEWALSLSHDVQGEFPMDTNSILYGSGALMPDGIRTVRPSGSQWNFLGVSSGESIWVFPQVQGAAPNAVWPGLSTEQTSSSILGTWDPETPVVGSGKWMELSLVGMAYYGTATVHEFSMWTTGTFGTPNVWMSTKDGISGLDAFPMLPGGHSHMNWGFTSEGVYDLTFQLRTYLANGALAESDPVTVRFGINAIAVPEPGTIALLVMGGVLTILRRERSVAARNLKLSGPQRTS
ncbi:putative secreted protein with PEP-CTERM sorting signal/surface-anchored protein [Roseimicrobium gellanilyticum]|uniref:Putative secreted protein with PEP-CTERM sorting signal/surface-anchored protein n=1 Tax=Roseimicrobium gellanilyticum TaxID=748857 RepID=A0A366HXI1_9BACT|nr:choice-of-anchor M domain-containing protein [Roseimicrobium gellanilyticum]RBP48028.1 putative secreted protein with PEP-CTERM sorting signal/surface-anchored protein [Roseimicrobium gellanilyticum]